MGNELAVLEAVRSSIEKQYGAKATIDSSDAPVGIHTGISGIDRYIGGHGFPRGMVSEVSGLTQLGKSTLMVEACAQANRNGERAVYIDVEGTTTLDYAERLGCEPSLFDLYNTQVSAEANLDMARTFVKCGAYGLVVIDSLAALVPKIQMDDGGDDFSLPKALTMGLRALVAATKGSNCAVVFTNQMRMKHSHVFDSSGNPVFVEKPSGPLMVDHAVALRLQLSGGEPILDKSGQDIGCKVNVTVTKNKLGRANVTCSINKFYETGFNKEAEVLHQAASLGIISRKGKSVFYNGECLGKTAAEACDLVRHDPSLFDKLYLDVIETAVPVVKPQDAF